MLGHARRQLVGLGGHRRTVKSQDMGILRIVQSLVVFPHTALQCLSPEEGV